MAIKRLEISNPEYAQPNTTLLTIHSSHINRRQDVSVYHNCDSKQDVPIVLLMHGVYGSNWVWMELGGAHKVYEQLKLQGLTDFVLVMPSDGGLWDGSAYLPLKHHGDYEQWIIDDVLNCVIANIPQTSEKSNVYISGLSMGGYGALRLGAKFPNVFKGISAHSSVTNLDDLQQFIDNSISEYQCEFEHEADILYWIQKNQSKLPPMRFDCGTNDSLFKSNLALVEQLNELNIDFVFEQFPGGHEWPYWNKYLAKTLMFFSKIERT
ncbi:MAG: prolyl oligopeptidase family serine peptidase [Gammaproteobacteria bacterium]|nr:prolyl oligopeptidase family serine peptidase [Gammaproteobacteria bacterium]